MRKRNVKASSMKASPEYVHGLLENTEGRPIT
jgi:hypothetical protein